MYIVSTTTSTTTTTKQYSQQKLRRLEYKLKIIEFGANGGVFMNFCNNFLLEFSRCYCIAFSDNFKI